MDSLNSLSKGIFVLPNGFAGTDVRKKKRSSKFQISKSKFDSEVNVQRWDEEFEDMWQSIYSDIETFQNKRNESSLTELIDFVEQSYAANGTQQNVVEGTTYLPVAALLTGINKPDHHQYFKTFANKLIARNNQHIAVLPARDCPNMKSTIEALVSSIISSKFNFKEDDDDNEVENKGGAMEVDDDESMSDADEPTLPQFKLKRNQYTMEVLHAWYLHQNPSTIDEPKPKISVIIPNFEEFSSRIIQDFIQTLSNYCDKLPIVLIIGVATSTSTIFQSLSVSETTRIKLRAFSSESASSTLNTIIDNILLTPRSPFHLSGHTLRNLTDVFLFYDFTTTEFMKSFKFCMLEHYSQGNEYSICARTYARAKERIAQLTRLELDNLRKLPSFRTFIEKLVDAEPRRAINLLTDSEYFRIELKEFIADIYRYLLKFHCYIRVLLVMVKDLPLAPLGKLLRVLYVHCFNQRENVVECNEFKQCLNLMEGMAKEQLISMILKCNDVMEDFMAKYCSVENGDGDKSIESDVRGTIEETSLQLMEQAERLSNVQINSTRSYVDTSDLYKLGSRDNLKQKLLELAAQTKSETHSAVKNLIKYIENDVIGKHLVSFFNAPPLIELFVFTKSELLKAHVNGAPRGAIDTALSNPYSYLDCSCCKIDNSHRLLPTLPEISVAYKLLLESGQHVNLYDWLQAYWCVLEDAHADDDNENDVPPLVQAKFVRARAELEYLGYIKSSKRKTDHVTRLVW